LAQAILVPVGVGAPWEQVRRGSGSAYVPRLHASGEGRALIGWHRVMVHRYS